MVLESLKNKFSKNNSVNFSEKQDSVKDLNAVIDFFKHIDDDVKKLLPELEKLKELEKERLVAEEGLLQINLETQIKTLENVLINYESLQNDTDINRIRMKKVTQFLLKNCSNAGLKDLVKEKKKDRSWKFNW